MSAANGQKRLVLTSDTEGLLVAPEAYAALPPDWDKAACPLEELTPERLARNLALPPGRSAFPGRPSLFFCVNFRGLDKHGEAFRLWQRAGVPVAVWGVDNPWNLLSGLRDAFWKDVFLFVTDASFLPGLKAAGARHACHLPLAADARRFATDAAPEPVTPPLNPLVFVGRSAFPDKARFFVGQSVPKNMLHAELERTRVGERPDFFHWLHALGLDGPDTALWPGSAARKASLGAEECSFAWRLACLKAALPEGLTVFGDQGWKTLLPEGTPAGREAPDLRGPLDYYGSLGRVYRNAEFSLAMTSFLLPAGLNQRHFDVWAAGGFCLTDATPGLDLFPQELAEPVTFRRPEDIPRLAARFRADPEGKRELAARWRSLILAEHNYGQRMGTLLSSIFS